jgi:hypothetical protein
VKTVQRRLGHATAAETLDTYAHLWPDSDDRTRDAIDAVLQPTTEPARPRLRAIPSAPAGNPADDLAAPHARRPAL